MPNDKLRSYLHFHLIVFIWGFTAVLGALISLDAVPLVWYRMLMASGFIFIWIKWKKKETEAWRQKGLGDVDRRGGDRAALAHFFWSY